MLAVQYVILLSLIDSMPRLTARAFTNSLSLNGTSDSATLPFTPSTSGFSVAFFVQRQQLVGLGERIISWVDNGVHNGFDIVNNDDPGTTDQIAFALFNATTTQAYIYSEHLTGEWVHITCTYSANSAKIYTNAVLSSTDTSCVMTASSSTLTIGKRAYAGISFFKGFIDEFVFKNGTPFTQTEINDLYYHGIIPTGANCYIDFNQRVTDLTGNGNSATLSGTSYSTNVPSVARSSAGVRTSTNARSAVT